MTACNFEKLVEYLDNRLNLDKRLELLEHIEQCDTCRDAIYQISRDRDAEYFIYRPYRVEAALPKA